MNAFSLIASAYLVPDITDPETKEEGYKHRYRNRSFLHQVADHEISMMWQTEIILHGLNTNYEDTFRLVV